MNLSRFSAFALTRAEMKNVVGGGNCMVCSQRKDGVGGGCSSASWSYTDANNLANSYNTNPPEAEGNYYYYVAPIGCG
jgi:hypothetical protein